MADENDDVVSTDEAILRNIGELEDESSSSESSDQEDTRTATDADGQTPQSGGEQSATRGNGTEQSQQASGPQDLKDANGNIIATGGKERRFYETAQREKARADAATQEAETLLSQIEAINSAGSVGKEYDLTPEEVVTGAQIIAAYKKDPVGTLQFMLTQAQGAGHNVDDIISGGTNMGAVKQMLDTALQPLVAEQKVRLDTQEANDNAAKVYNEFISQHPDVVVHQNTIARLLQEQDNLSLEAAYHKLQNYYLRRNLDWTKSLEQLQQEAATRPSVNTQSQLPDGGINPANTTDEPQVADVNTSTEDIVRAAMADAGITA
tara:strand:- start:62 stop:1027 length:966 start_codon:yes stop_codon:yes gene_type:complete